MNPDYERPVIAVAVVLPALFLVCFFTLGAAIDWPNSLNGSAADYLPLVAANADTVRIGYAFYFAASGLHAVLAVLLTIHLGAARRPWLAVAAVVGVLAGLFKMLGIARWLEAMPLLAGHLASAPETTAVVYELLNDYAGVTLGEGVGVGLFTGLWFGLLALAGGAADGSGERALPGWLRGYFAVTALSSFPAFLGIYGLEGPDWLGLVNGNLQYYGYWFLAAALAWPRIAAARAGAGLRGRVAS